MAFLVVFRLGMLGGGFFPFEFMPECMARVGRLPPNGWALVQLRALLEGPAPVARVTAGFAGLAGALGVLLGNLARTEGQVVALGVAITNVLAALGGCWWPIEITPRWVQSLSLLLPTGLTMDALHQLVSFGAAPAAVLPHLIGLAAALLAGWAAARTFRHQ